MSPPLIDRAHRPKLAICRYARRYLEDQYEIAIMACTSHRDHPARLAALAAGEKTFDTGQPCPKGHSSPRYVSNGGCSECTRLFMQAKTEARRIAKGLDPNQRYGKRKPDARKVSKPKKKKFVKDTTVRVPFYDELHDYSLTAEARRNSDYLDSLTRKLTASASKKVPDGKRKTLA